jgi:hypothetical protein
MAEQRKCDELRPAILVALDSWMPRNHPTDTRLNQFQGPPREEVNASE